MRRPHRQKKLTLWDLLETLINGSHICDKDFKDLDYKLSLKSRNAMKFFEKVGCKKSEDLY